MIEHIMQAAILLISGSSIAMFASKDRKWRMIGFCVAICGQPLWWYTSWQAGKWGIFVLSLWFTVNHARGIFNNRKATEDYKKQFKWMAIDGDFGPILSVSKPRYNEGYWFVGMYKNIEGERPHFLKQHQLWDRICPENQLAKSLADGRELWNGYWWRMTDDYAQTDISKEGE